MNRDKNDEKIAMERMKQFNNDVLHWNEYDFVVVNEDLEKCFNEIIGYIENKINYNKDIIEDHIKMLI